MKKAILIVAALVLILSGVAAVSAYEAHLINVRAHVENAMSVTVEELDFGTVFPEEWMIKEFTVQVSESFCKEDQLRVTYIDYAVWAEWKPDPAGGYYYWLGDALYVGIDAAVKKPVAAGGDLVLVGDAPAGPPGAKWVMDAPVPLHKVTPNINSADLITIGLDAPVFEGYYNPLTDPEPKPSGLNDPTLIIMKNDPRWNPDGVDLGVDIKIQVTWIGATPAP
jgi:hypothetical protein